MRGQRSTQFLQRPLQTRVFYWPVGGYVSALTSTRWLKNLASTSGNLYDLTTAQAEKTESRFKQFEAAIDNRLTDIQAALQALLAARSPRRARKRVN